MQPTILSHIRSASFLVLSLTAVSCTHGPPYRPDGNVFIEQGAKPKPQTGSPNAAPTETPGVEKPADPGSATTDPNATPVPPVDPNATPAVKPENPVTDPATPPTTEIKPKPNLPFGTPVIGKRGFVYSPYAPDKGMVDVSDIPSGTKVECPYTKKIFRVP